MRDTGRPKLIVISLLVFAVLSISGIGFDLYFIAAIGEFSGNVAFGLIYWITKAALALLIWFRFEWARWGLLIVLFGTSLGTAAYEYIVGSEGSFTDLYVKRTSGNWVFLAQAVALIFLFLPASSRWLRGTRDAVT